MVNDEWVAAAALPVQAAHVKVEIIDHCTVQYPVDRIPHGPPEDQAVAERSAPSVFPPQQ